MEQGLLAGLALMGHQCSGKGIPNLLPKRIQTIPARSSSGTSQGLPRRDFGGGVPAVQGIGLGIPPLIHIYPKPSLGCDSPGLCLELGRFLRNILVLLSPDEKGSSGSF